jgi:hypothetical protein
LPAIDGNSFEPHEVALAALASSNPQVQSAVVVMIYLGGSQFTGTAFVQTAQRANGRIP